MAKQRTTTINIDYNATTGKLEKSNALLQRASTLVDNLNKSIDGTKKSADAAGASYEKAANKGAQSFGNFSTILKTVSFTALAAGLLSITKKIFDLGVAQEQTNIAFETLVGNTAKAKKLLQELTKFSLITPFTPDQVNKAAKTLLAFGVVADDIIPTLKLIGDVSSGTGKDLSEMAVIFGQIRSTGRLMGQDLLQLINAGFNPLQVISQKTGKSMRDLKSAMEEGLISFDMVEQAFKDATSEGGLFFNLMEKQSASIGGMLSTIEGNIDEIAKKLFETRRGALAEFTQGLVEVTGQTNFWADATNAVINQFTSAPNLGIAVVRAISKEAKEAAQNTERLRIEQLALQLALAKGDLDTFNETGFGNRVEIIQRIVRLLDEMGVKQPTTEDPLPWATPEEGAKKIGIIQALEDKIKSLHEAIKTTTDSGDLGAQGKLVKSLKEAEEELSKLLGKEKDRNKKKKKEANEVQEYLAYLSDLELFQTKTLLNEKKEQRDTELENAKENAKRSFEHWKFYNDLKLRKQKEAADEALLIEEEAAIKKLDRDRLIFDLSEQLLRNSLEMLVTTRNDDVKNVSDYYDKQIELAGDNDRRKKELEINRERELEAARQRQKEADKRAASTKILIDGLVAIAKIFGEFGWPAGIVPAAIMAGITAVNVAQVGKYKEGGWIKGPGSETSDSVPILASKNEFMVNAGSAKKAPKLLEQINSGKLNDKMLKELMSGRSGGSHTQILDDSNIVKELRELKNSQPDIVQRGNLIYETRKKSDNYKQWIRSKSMNL